MLLAKTTNLDTGAQSEEFPICANCYSKLDDAITHANAETGTDIELPLLPMLLKASVSSVGKTNATLVRLARFNSALAYCIRPVRIRVRAGYR